jgi:hypothetical protein
VTFIPLNTRNSLGQNFNQLNDVIRVLNAKKNLKVVKSGTIRLIELTTTSGGGLLSTVEVSETHNLGYIPYGLAFYDVDTFFVPFNETTRIDDVTTSGGAITNLLLYQQRFVVSNTEVAVSHSYESIGASGTSAFTATAPTVDIAYVLFQEKLVAD